MAFRDAGRQDRGVEADSVVGDLQHRRAAAAVQGHGHVPGAGVLVYVGK